MSTSKSSQSGASSSRISASEHPSSSESEYSDTVETSASGGARSKSKTQYLLEQADKFTKGKLKILHKGKSKAQALEVEAQKLITTSFSGYIVDSRDELNNLASQISALETKLSEASEAIEYYQDCLLKEEAVSQKSSHDLKQKKLDYQKLSDTLKEVEEEKHSLEEELAKSKDKYRELFKTYQITVANLQDAEEHAETLCSNLDAEKRLNADISQELIEVRTILQDSQKHFEQSSSKQEKDSQVLIDDLTSQIHQLRTQNQTLSSQLTEEEAVKSNLTKDFEKQFSETEAHFNAHIS